ncbi:hypothetical protein V6N11_012626 [Hibiscus sabdariffa]|uniref:Uncharacterized protein n=1 Tax=Hibiscus sabdariffa TaxID=183260 RepID=A0ABR2QBS5_9ROSI
MTTSKPTRDFRMSFTASKNRSPVQMLGESHDIEGYLGNLESLFRGDTSDTTRKDAYDFDNIFWDDNHEDEQEDEAGKYEHHLPITRILVESIEETRAKGIVDYEHMVRETLPVEITLVPLSKPKGIVARSSIKSSNDILLGMRREISFLPQEYLVQAETGVPTSLVMTPLVKLANDESRRLELSSNFQSNKYAKTTREASQVLGLMSKVVGLLREAYKELNVAFAQAVEKGQQYKSDAAAKNLAKVVEKARGEDVNTITMANLQVVYGNDEVEATQVEVYGIRELEAVSDEAMKRWGHKNLLPFHLESRPLLEEQVTNESVFGPSMADVGGFAMGSARKSTHVATGLSREPCDDPLFP